MLKLVGKAGPVQNCFLWPCICWNYNILYLCMSTSTIHELYNYNVLQEMQTKFATKINELNQQVTHLQQENEKFQSLTTGATSKPSHESDQEFHSSVGHIDQPAQLQKRLKELESELESTRPTLEAERKRYEEKLEEMKAEILHIQSTKQVKLLINLKQWFRCH